MNWEALEDDSPVDEETFAFGSFRLIPAQRVLFEDGKPLRLGGRALDILISLVESAGETIGKDQLIARTWPDTVVDEGALRVHVAALRKALGEGRAGKRYIANIQGRGYSFIAPVTREQRQPTNGAAGRGNFPSSLPPLEVPPASGNLAPDDALRYSAVQLFADRAMATDGFSLADADVSAVLEICRRLDGVPLALELAAARVDAFGVKGRAGRLDDRFAVLTKRRRTALPRHQTLRAAIDWSYDLLPEIEQVVFRRLAVFRGSFTMEAAAAVAVDERIKAADVIEGVVNLVGKSLIMTDLGGNITYFRLLDTTRSYALDKLTDRGEAEQAARRHAEFFRDLIAPAVPGSPLQPAIEDVARYGREIDNVRAALDWAFSPVGDPSIGAVLTAAYVPVWLNFALMAECTERTERALDSLELDLNLS